MTWRADAISLRSNAGRKALSKSALEDSDKTRSMQNRIAASDASDSRRVKIPCSICGIPLSGRNQFLGHMSLSHEISTDLADSFWLILDVDASLRNVLGET